MAKLFRKAKMDSIKSLKIVNYTWYAIGEIILIFVGINFAIWFDDQNEYNKERELEIKILQEIKSNLDNDLNGLDSDIVFLDWIEQSCDTLIDYLENKKVYHDSLDNIFPALVMTPHFNPNNSGYELLQSKGVEIILNDTLRRTITELYESTYDYYLKYESEKRLFIEYNVESILKDKFLSFETSSGSVLKPINYKMLQNNTAFLSIIYYIKGRNYIVKQKAIMVKQHIQSITEIMQNKLSDKIE